MVLGTVHSAASQQLLSVGQCAPESFQLQEKGFGQEPHYPSLRYYSGAGSTGQLDACLVLLTDREPEGFLSWYY